MNSMTQGNGRYHSCHWYRQGEGTSEVISTDNDRRHQSAFSRMEVQGVTLASPKGPPLSPSQAPPPYETSTKSVLRVPFQRTTPSFRPSVHLNKDFLVIATQQSADASIGPSAEPQPPQPAAATKPRHSNTARHRRLRPSTLSKGAGAQAAPNAGATEPLHVGVGGKNTPPRKPKKGQLVITSPVSSGPSTTPSIRTASQFGRGVPS